MRDRMWVCAHPGSRGGCLPGCSGGHRYRAWKLHPVGARGHRQEVPQCLGDLLPQHFRHTRKCWGEDFGRYPESCREDSRHFRHAGAWPREECREHLVLIRMEAFYLENFNDAFGCMSSLLEENFYFGYKKLNYNQRKNTIGHKVTNTFLDNINFKKLSMIRRETENLYFNAQSSWRWCDFTAHPRVITYADRTGIDLTDIRSPSTQTQKMFSIGQTAECKKGERVVLLKHLNDVNAYHHLVTSQVLIRASNMYSAYIMDERFPCVPLLKWEHMLKSPPIFSQILSGDSCKTSNKILLGTQRSQEVLMLQYSDGTQMAYEALGPPLQFPARSNCSRFIPFLLPHEKEVLFERLLSPGAGLAAIYHPHQANVLCVIQLAETGDVFYQTWSRQESSSSMARPRGSDANSSEKDHRQEKEREDHGVFVSSSTSHGDAPKETCTFGDTRPINHTSNPNQNTNVTQRCEGNTPLTESVGLSKKALAKLVKWNSNVLQKQTVKRQEKFCKVKNKATLALPKIADTATNHSLYPNIRQKMRVAMEEKKTLSTCLELPSLEVVDIPGHIDPSSWKDDLSKRLTASWDGKWNSWWENKLGLNRKQKIEALRKKRKLQKLARGHRSPGLSGSFTSSVTYQSDLTDFSDLSGWSSADSNFGGSRCSSPLSDIETDSHKGPSTVVAESNTDMENVRLGEEQDHECVPNSVTASSVSSTSQYSAVPNLRQKSADSVSAFSAMDSLAQNRISVLSASKDKSSAVTGHPSPNPRLHSPRKSLTQNSHQLQKKANQDLASLLIAQDSTPEPDLEDNWIFPLASSTQKSSQFSASPSLLGLPLSQGSVTVSQPKKKRPRMGF
ncbi:TAF1C polymerase, partial [Polypterus senegalus]